MKIDLEARGKHSPTVLGPGDYVDGVTVAGGVWRPSGLTLRVRDSGVRVYVVRYTAADGLRRRHVIGDALKMSLADARERARIVLVDVGKGADPVAAIKAKREARSKEITFGDMARSWLAHGRNAKGKPLRPTTVRQWSGLIEKRLLPAFGNRPAAKITRSEVRGFLEGIAKETPVLSLRVLECMRRVYTFGLSREKVATTPFLGLKASEIAAPAMRQRWLNHDELKAIVNALDDSMMGVSDVRSFILLILLTAARHEEVLSAPWSEFDLTARRWRISATRHKGGRGHEIPLVPWAVDVLVELRARHPGATYVFPGANGEGPRVSIQRAFEAFRNRLGLAEWRVHDLRRTVADEVSKLKYGPHIVEALLGHAEGRLSRTYRGHVPLDEIESALTAWSIKLREIADGREAGSVLAFRR